MAAGQSDRICARVCAVQPSRSLARVSWKSRCRYPDFTDAIFASAPDLVLRRHRLYGLNYMYPRYSRKSAAIAR